MTATLAMTMPPHPHEPILIIPSRLPLISATGSCRMGREVGVRVAGRLGQSLLELGGNNGMIVAPSADLKLAMRAILFSAVGTAGQRCTSLRRLIVHEDVYDALLPGLKRAYGSVSRSATRWRTACSSGR